MSLLIDGYNLIYADEELAAAMLQGKLERARDSLLSRLIRYQALSGEKVTVVFDGTVTAGRQVQKHAGVRVLFSRAPVKADAEIEALVAAEGNPRQLRVVSSDRAVRATAKGYNAESVDSETFLKQMRAVMTRKTKKTRPPEPGEKYGKAISPLEIQHWLKIFGEDNAKGG